MKRNTSIPSLKGYDVLFSLIVFIFFVNSCQDSPSAISSKYPKNVDEKLEPITPPKQVADTSFTVFDGTRFKEKPEMTQFGFTPVEIVYSGRIWKKPLGEVGPWELPLKYKVTKWAKKAREVNGKIAIVNLERWPNTGPAPRVQRTIENLSMVYDWFKEGAPGMKFGYYGTVPKRNYFYQTSLATRQSWKAKNDLLRPLAQKVDALFPSLYTYEQDREFWVESSKIYLQEARRIADGKPVYAFLWPQYYSKRHKELKDKYIEADFWRLQLETARMYADGVVIWFPYQTKWQQASKGPWWNVTQAFLKKIGRKSEP